ncbi:tetratricopeptide repeat protein [Polymorphospora rubra]|uniref:tetratricopeptide repeat protein n=1 Tax=Polymorphospora rubra TaxID=338584 RepID=UPI0033DC7674
MDAVELDRRFRTYDGWIPPWVVSTLVEHGHLGEVRVQADLGDWYCAHEVVGVLLDQDRLQAALDVLRPFVDSGWWEAVKTLADILEQRGRRDEAIALVRPYAEVGDRLAVARLAGMLSRQGRVDDVIALLRPGIEDWYLAEALVELTAGQGRDGEVTALLRGLVEAKQRQAAPRFAEPRNAETLLATVLERQGRVDDAVALLHEHLRGDGVGAVNVLKHLADILARHGRETQLRDFVAGAGGEYAAYRLAAHLEGQGRLREAVEALRPFTAGGSRNPAAMLAELLTRHGRVDEAIAVLRPVAVPMGGDGWTVRMLWTLLADQGRVDEALTVIDDLAVEAGGMSTEPFLERILLLAYCGRFDQAIVELRNHREADTWYMVGYLADVLADAGRLDEAVAVLSSSDHHVVHATALATLLIRQGRVAEAVEILHNRVLLPNPDDPWASLPAD